MKMSPAHSWNAVGCPCEAVDAPSSGVPKARLDFGGIMESVPAHDRGMELDNSSPARSPDTKYPKYPQESQSTSFRESL